MLLQLKRFDPASIHDADTCMLIGKRNTGKSVLLRDIMSYKRHVPLCIVMSPTEATQGFFRTWVPDSFIYNDFDPAVIDRLIDTQTKRSKAGCLTNVVVILDDCMFDTSLLKNKSMRYLFMNGRHLKIMTIVTAQYSGDIPPAIRCNIDFVFVLRDNIIQNRERLYKNFFGLLPSFGAFQQLMDATTENYECLVLNNKTQSNRLEDSMFYYKASLHHSFRMGSPGLWRFHNDRYDPDHDERPRQERPDPRRQRINIKKLR